jgi:hypothetical protein
VWNADESLGWVVAFDEAAPVVVTTLVRVRARDRAPA